MERHIKTALNRKKMEQLIAMLSQAENNFINANNMALSKQSELKAAENLISNCDKALTENSRRIEVCEKRINVMKTLLAENPDWDQFKNFAQNEIGMLEFEIRELQDNMLKLHNMKGQAKENISKLQHELNDWLSNADKAKQNVEKIKAEIERLKVELTAPKKRTNEAVSHSRSPSAEGLAGSLTDGSLQRGCQLER